MTSRAAVSPAVPPAPDEVGSPPAGTSSTIVPVAGSMTIPRAARFGSTPAPRWTASGSRSHSRAVDVFPEAREFPGSGEFLDARSPVLNEFPGAEKLPADGVPVPLLSVIVSPFPLEPCASSAHYWSVATELGLTPPAQVFRRLLLRRSVSHPGSPTVPTYRRDGTMIQNHRTERTFSRSSGDEYTTAVNSSMCRGSLKWLAAKMVFL
jgi:hypothetical protein